MTEIEALEREIIEKSAQLAQKRREKEAQDVRDYAFKTATGETSLSQLFADKERLFVIHNMGQGCRYCSLWADGLNGILDHLEDAMAVVLVSKDPPDIQRKMALDRGWRFRMASHGGGDYMEEQCSFSDYKNMPGSAVYEIRDGKIKRRGRTFFGPGDLYSPMWHILGLAGIEQQDWTPQFHYWKRPQDLEDGGENVND